MKNFILALVFTGGFISLSFFKNKDNEKNLATKQNYPTIILVHDTVDLSQIAGKVESSVEKIVTKRVVPKVSVSKDERLYNFSPINDLNYQISHWGVNELKEDMKRHQFINLEGLKLNELKEIRMAYYNDKLLWDVHERTDLGIGVIWAFLRIEAYDSKINESRLLRNAWNFGGIKFSPKLHKNSIYAFDDCKDRKGRKVACGFAKFDSYEEGMEAWANVFNAPRYRNCKKYGNTLETFSCIYQSGYHTQNNVRVRNELCKRYWTLRKHFPITRKI